MSMKGKWVWIALAVLVFTSPSWAQLQEDPVSPQTRPAGSESLDDPDIKEGLTVGSAVALIGVCFGAGLCVLGGGYGIARIGGACIESISRQPEAAGSMFAPMIISAAMVEGATLFAIVVCLMGILKV